MEDEKVTLSQAADIVGLSESYLRTFCQDGSLPAEQLPIGTRHIWRVEREVLLAWKQQHDATKGKPGRKPSDGKN